MMQEFHLGDLLSVTTYRLLSPEGMDGVYKILNFLTQDNLFTHQLPRAAEESKLFLLQCYPFLEKIDASDVNKNNHEDWLEQQVRTYGEFFELTPIPEELHQRIDPFEELLAKRFEGKVDS